MRRGQLVVISTLLISSCTSVPDFESQSPLALTKVSHQIECELKNTFKAFPARDGLDFDDWVVSYTITNNSRRDTGVSVNPFRWIIPSGVDSLVFNAGASVSRYTERTATVDFSRDIATLHDLKCADAPETPHRRNDLRVTEWVSAIYQAKAAQKFGYTTEFNTEVSGNAGLGIQDGQASGTGDLSGKRRFRHTVYFAFAPKSVDAGPQRVYVVNLPGQAPAKGTTVRRPGDSRARPAVPRALLNGIPGAIRENQETIQQLRLENLRRDQ